MSQNEWEEAAKKLKNAFEKGMILIKEGAKEANYVREKAIDIIKLEMEAVRLKNKSAAEFEKLGRALAKAAAKSKSLKISQANQDLARSAIELGKEHQALSEKVKNFSVTRKKSM